MGWRVGLLVALGCGLCIEGCSGGYPIPPTRCDEFCDATKGFDCPEFYGPAECVSSCEQSNADTQACRAELDAVISCYRAQPEAAARQCDFSSGFERPRPCADEQTRFQNCLGASYLLPQPRE